MKYSPLPLVAALILCVVVPTHAHETRVYEHPSLDFRFSAPEGMQPVAHPEDDLAYEVVDPKTGIHVLLWYTTTEQGPSDYLKKMASMKELVFDQKPQATRIDQRDAWVLRQPDRIVGKSMQTLLAVIAGGRSRIHPKESALYIVEIWSPAEGDSDNWRIREDIFRSVKIETHAQQAKGR
jgi:hypothetical protein